MIIPDILRIQIPSETDWLHIRFCRHMPTSQQADCVVSARLGEWLENEKPCPLHRRTLTLEFGVECQAVVFVS
jgi:hypothetical protein